ncbi:hypothetical protein B0H14DRAFT_3735576 [Mycena olivaceomarginata]|nr:hypothetical protein B0H14DRAFT_3735576 [Mycena olivaceomarginata]
MSPLKTSFRRNTTSPNILSGNGVLVHRKRESVRTYPQQIQAISLAPSALCCRLCARSRISPCPQVYPSDLKGENLLVTSNGRLKLTGFGFARIAARNDEESKRLTFCGTDLYMSPEILLGDEFDLPTDIFSFGIILCEIAARKLADDNHFKRTAPTFGIDREEVHRLANPGCPLAFLSLAIDCLSTDPAARPSTRDVLERLRVIEAEVLARPNGGDNLHVGSVRLMTTGKRADPGPTIPSFGVGVGKDIRSNSRNSSNMDADDSEDEPMKAVMELPSIGDGNTDWSEGANSYQPLLYNNFTSSMFSHYSATVIRAHPSAGIPSLSSILTVRGRATSPAADSPDSKEEEPVFAEVTLAALHGRSPSESGNGLLGGCFFPIASVDWYQSAHLEGGSTIRSLQGNYTAPLAYFRTSYILEKLFSRYSLLRNDRAKVFYSAISGTMYSKIILKNTSRQPGLCNPILEEVQFVTLWLLREILGSHQLVLPKGNLLNSQPFPLESA